MRELTDSMHSETPETSMFSCDNTEYESTVVELQSLLLSAQPANRSIHAPRKARSHTCVATNIENFRSSVFLDKDMRRIVDDLGHRGSCYWSEFASLQSISLRRY